MERGLECAAGILFGEGEGDLKSSEMRTMSGWTERQRREKVHPLMGPL